jgi:hypothetical protein
VDLDQSSPVRRQFTDEVLRRPVEAIRRYWQQRIFAGRGVPPPEMESDEDVISLVRREEGAVGYISASVPLTGVKVLTVR